MAPAIRMKVDLPKDKAPKTVQDRFEARRFRSGQTVSTLDDKDAKSLVDGGFADYLDSQGNVATPDTKSAQSEGLHESGKSSGDKKSAKKPSKKSGKTEEEGDK